LDLTRIPTQVPEAAIGFFRRMAAIADISKAVLLRGVNHMATTGTGFILPLCYLLGFCVKMGNTLMADGITPYSAQLVPGIGYRARLYCTFSQTHVYNVYMWDATSDVRIDVRAICACANCRSVFTEAPVGSGTTFHYVSIAPQLDKLNESPRYVENPAFRLFTRWTFKKHRARDTMTFAWMRSRGYSAAMQRKKQIEDANCGSLDQWINNLGGFVRVIVDDTEGVQKTKWVYQGHNILCLIWIVPWAVTAYREATYLQLDCSYPPTDPSVYCTPQGMICNEAVPLGFIMAPRECAFTYTTFMEDLWSLFGDEAFTKRPVLSDEHKGLDAFCTAHDLKHFYCHCHLIRKHGAGSTAGMIASQVLRIQTKEEFDELQPQLIKNLPHLVDNGLLTQKKADELEKWLKDFHDGIWERVALGIARCTNHAERFHGIVNRRMKDKAVRAPPRRLEVLREVIMERAAVYGSGAERQITYALAALLKKESVQVAECHDHVCDEYCKMMARRFDMDSFPCSHTVKAFSYVLPKRKSLEVAADQAKVQTPNGTPIVTLKSEILDPVRRALSAAKRPQKKAKRAQLRALCAALRPAAKDFKVKEQAVIEWVDEGGPPAHASDAVVGTECYASVRNIVSGVIALRLRAKRLRMPHKLEIAAVIYHHFREQFAAQSFAPNDTETRLDWLAGYTAHWWDWAAHGRNYPPRGESLTQEPEDREIDDDEDQVIRIEVE
jgi:hypothetical protein